ncbi:MAG: iron-sulfur cluster assembly accessory protein [Candidatus Heimdallarchaeota archaeon]|nr:iron-sulfur cluster assembly accessory protein [Candidatus Heimdallarchaeota archaeon]MDH5646573.1 iron-sulfur cluster assembly accessory protein [Candidatus Heimdallarchaeota archaeon]
MATEVTQSIITLSTQAVNQIRAVIDQQPNSDKLFLRVYVQGGCGGVSYGMAIDQRMQADDHETEIDGIKVVIDRISYQYVEGATIDFTSEGGKEGFRINNPNADKLMQEFGGGGGCCSTGGSGGGCGSGSGGGCGSGSGGCC